MNPSRRERERALKSGKQMTDGCARGGVHCLLLKIARPKISFRRVAPLSYASVASICVNDDCFISNIRSR
ncbi:hypothetical protein I7I50_10346 [Histoplasma capsulatum G186AR]|nr:hypothetical protein I7I50_10346 [Histoplasma capsulatum G186AR]